MQGIAARALRRSVADLSREVRAGSSQWRTIHASSVSGFAFPYDQSPFATRSPPANTILRIVPQQSAFVVERFGKYSRTLAPGLHILIPVVRLICERAEWRVAVERACEGFIAQGTRRMGAF